MKAWFDALADRICTAPRPGSGIDRIMLSLASEHTDFVRFNRGAVRQMTRVEQHQAALTLVTGRCRITGSTSLSGNVDADSTLLIGLRDALAVDLPMVPPDPHLRLPDTIADTFRDDADDDAASANAGFPSAERIVARVVDQARGLDLVGFYAAGPVIAAFADSRGQRNWHRVRSFHFDWSLFCSDDPAVRDRAVKSIYAGARWDDAEFARRMTQARERLALLARPSSPISPGRYRVWLEPMAMAEMLGTLAWGGFGLKDRRTGTSPLLALDGGKRLLSPRFTLAEATADGIAPAFTPTGHVRPPSVALVTAGTGAQTLVSPRSAAEFGVTANADEAESPASLSLTGGDLDDADTLTTLDTGLWISNLWYLNYSDRHSCRMTGMTRFACFRVEHGEIVAPIDVMRFDDEFPRLFGQGLLALSREVDFLHSSDTYGSRHLGSISSPGALLADMRFTL